VTAVLALLAASTGFKITVALHIVAVIAAFGPLLVMGRLWAGDPQGTAKLYVRMSLPSLVLVWVLGMGAVGASGSGEEKISMSDTWVILSLLVWAILVAVAVAVIMPAVKATGEAARSRLMAGVGTSHLLMAVAVVLMVFKPGG
jgi:uncharacterized membrane protein